MGYSWFKALVRRSVFSLSGGRECVVTGSAAGWLTRCYILYLGSYSFLYYEGGVQHVVSQMLCIDIPCLSTGASQREPHVGYRAFGLGSILIGGGIVELFRHGTKLP